MSRLGYGIFFLAAVHADSNNFRVLNWLRAQQTFTENGNVSYGFSAFLATDRFCFTHFWSLPFGEYLFALEGGFGGVN